MILSRNLFIKLERRRYFFLGAILPLVESLSMILLIKYFSPTINQKTFLVVLLKSTFLLGIPFILWISTKKINLSTLLSRIYLISFFLLLIESLWQNFYLFYMVFFMLTFCLNGLNSINSEFNSFFFSGNRGKQFSRVMIYFILGTIISTFLYRYLFDYLRVSFEIILLVGAGYCLGAYSSVRYFPTKKMSEGKAISFKQLIDILKNDHFFVKISFAWFLLGFANLWIMPYRVNVLIEPTFKFQYSVGLVLLLLNVIPEIFHLIFLPLFGKMFDKVNFIVARIVTATLFASSIASFFLGETLFLHLISSVFWGCAKAGGSIQWKLWVNKFAPANQVSLYALLHNGLTGIRMIMGSLIGLYSLNYLGPILCAYISLFLIALAIIIFYSLYRESLNRFIY